MEQKRRITPNIITSEPWKVGHDSGYIHGYFVYNVSGGYALTANGHIRRFGTLEKASALADQKNLEDQQEADQRRKIQRPGPGRSFEQAELEDEIASIDGCAVKVWSDDGIGETKRLHISDPRGTKILKGVIITASNTQKLEGHLAQLETELKTIRELRPRLGTSAEESLLCALENTLALLGTNIEEGITE